MKTAPLGSLAAFEVSHLQRAAVHLLNEGRPVPMDLIARLIEEGVDFSELERKYGQ